MLRKQFEAVLSEFGGIVGQELAFADDVVTFAVDDEVLVNLHYLNDSDYILAWSPIGDFGGEDDAKAGERALALLRLNDIGGETQGFTLALDADSSLVLALDRQSALALGSADALAAWLEALVQVVRTVRTYFVDNFPVKEAP